MKNKLNVICSVFCGEAERHWTPYLLPLGIVYCASALQQLDFCQVGSLLFDSECYYGEQEAYKRHIFHELKDRQADVLCISAMSNEYVKIRNIVNFLKENLPELQIILGGGLVSANPIYIMNHIRADFGIMGEGEHSLPQLLTAIYHHRIDKTISGLVFRQADRTISICKQHDIRALDEIVFPDYRLFPEYEEVIYQTGVYPMLLSRSCPFHCTFCFHTCGQTYRVRSAKNCIDEINAAVRRYPIRHIFFLDELFGANTSQLDCILERLQVLHITFNAQTRADIITDKMVDMLKNRGCTRLAVGIESASNQILQSMHKKLTIETIQNAMDIILRHQIHTSGNIIIGDKAETLETAQTSINWFEKHREQYNLSIGMLQCYPGTELYTYARSTGKIQEESYLENAEFPNDFVVNISKMPENVFLSIKRKVAELSFLYRESPDII